MRKHMMPLYTVTCKSGDHTLVFHGTCPRWARATSYGWDSVTVATRFVQVVNAHYSPCACGCGQRSLVIYNTVGVKS